MASCFLYRRREFITLLGGAAATWPIAARAQQPPMPVIGFLHNASLETRREGIAGFHRGLAEIGYIEGQNVTIDYRWAEGLNDRLPALAADLVRRQVAVIATPGSTQSALAAKTATQTIPIVFLLGTDPVEIGLVTSLNRPGGNITGISTLNVDVAAKRLELLHELVPAATAIAYLRNPTNPVFSSAETKAVQTAAQVLGVNLIILNASRQEEILAAFATLVQQQVGGLLISGEPLFFTHIDLLVLLAARHAIPTISHFREFVTAGGLIGYGPSLPSAYRQVGVYTGRILKGEKPADLPVQRASKVEFVINLKAARVIGLDVPTTVVARADEVIE
jgi:putative tryptophan/tyrosine transport system substrate-binding protein